MRTSHTSVSCSLRELLHKRKAGQDLQARMTAGMQAMNKDVTLDRPLIDKKGKFDNPWSTWEEKGFLDIMHWMLIRNRGKGMVASLEENKHPSAAEWAAAFPCHKPDLSAFKRGSGDGVRALWIGHASLLVQLGGVTFLTDPVFSDRCSPFSFMGPKRIVKTPFSLTDADLPNIDFVLISHNHYDHLDHNSVMQLHSRFGDSLKWYVPLKLGKWFASCGISSKNVQELDWWQGVQHQSSGVTIALTPAQHWSNRATDRRESLWGGFAVFDKQHRFYFAGDTAYCPVFKQIGQKFGPFDLSAIPIGAYEPRDIMIAQHCNPEEAVNIHKDVRSMRSLGIHCCTFCLTNEPLDEPLRRLKAAVKAAGLEQDAFVVMQHGSILATAGGKDAAKPQLL